jgi:hypothetical protein
MPYDPATPAHQLYGIIPQAYAQRLASSTGDPTADAINALNLGRQARGANMQGYEALIRSAQEMGMQAHGAEQTTKRQADYLRYIPDAAEYGGAGAIGYDPRTGMINPDPRAIRQVDAQQSGYIHSQTVGNVAGAMKDAADAGQKLPDSIVQGGMTSPYSKEYAPPTTNYIRPKDQEQLEIDRMEAEASMVAAKKPNGGGGGGDVTFTTGYQLMPDGSWQPTTMVSKGNAPPPPGPANGIRPPPGSPAAAVGPSSDAIKAAERTAAFQSRRERLKAQREKRRLGNQDAK